MGASFGWTVSINLIEKIDFLLELWVITFGRRFNGKTRVSLVSRNQELIFWTIFVTVPVYFT